MVHIKKSGIVLLLVSTLSGCMIWDMIKPSGGLSVDTELIAGDKTIATEVVGNKDTTNNTAKKISQVFNTVNEAEPILPWLVALLGLMLPTPTRMFQGLVSLFRRKKNA